MTIEMAKSLLMWCSIINYCILLLWFALFKFAHDAVQSLNDKVMGRKIAYFDTFHYAGIGLYKTAIIFFNVVPWIVLTILK